LGKGHNLCRRGKRGRGTKHRTRARRNTSRTKRRRGRDLYKVTFSITNLNYQKKIINNLQEVDVQNALF
jgi:hypothetical protein